jgi:hypothetical protein
VVRLSFSSVLCTSLLLLSGPLHGCPLSMVVVHRLIAILCNVVWLYQSVKDSYSYLEFIGCEFAIIETYTLLLGKFRL